MPVPALLMPLLAAVVQPNSAPITVRGHAWAPFISPMGEPFRARTEADDTLADWFRQADRDHDGALTEAEMQADAQRFFAMLDSDGSGEIDPDEVAHYEWEIAPDIQVMAKTMRAPGQAPATKLPNGDNGSRGRSAQREAEASLGLRGELQGAARYGLLNMPEPVAAADTDFNRGVTLAEFKEAAAARFALLDGAHHGRLDLSQLQAVRTSLLERRRRRGGEDDADGRVGNPLPREP